MTAGFKRYRMTAFWVLMVLVTAMSIVYVRHQSRALFTELQQAEAELDQLQIDWGRLQLEQATWAEASRIEAQARERLQLEEKQPVDVLVIVK